MLDEDKVMLDFIISLGLTTPFVSILRSSFTSAVDLFVQTHDFLEGVPPSLYITSVTSTLWSLAVRCLTLTAEISKTLFKNVVPMSEVLRGKTFKVVGTPILFIICEFTALEEEVEDLCPWIDRISIAYFIDLQRFGRRNVKLTDVNLEVFG